MSPQNLPFTPDAYRQALEATRSVAEVRAWMEREIGAEVDSPRADSVRVAVAQWSPHLDSSLVEDLLDLGLGVLLAENPHLGGPSRNTLVRRCLTLLLSGNPPVTRNFHLSAARSAFAPLLKRGLVQTGGSEMKSLWTRWRDKQEQTNYEHLLHLGLTLVSDPALSEEQLLELTLVDPRLLAIAIDHPAAGPALWLSATEVDGGHWRELSQHPVARVHPEIRSQLWEMGTHLGRSRIFRELARDGILEEFPRLVHELLERGALYLPEVLTEASPELLATLTRNDLLALLASESQELRLTAMSLLPEVQAEAKTPSRPSTTRVVPPRA